MAVSCSIGWPRPPTSSSPTSSRTPASVCSSTSSTSAPDVVAAKLYEPTHARSFDRAAAPNPIVGVYRTQDGRFIMLMMLESDRYWADFCRHIERPELIDDTRFKDAAARYENRRECIGLLDEVFASRPFAEWCSRFSTLEGVWALMQSVREVHDDPQSVANGYLPSVASADGVDFTLVASPVQFDETSPDLSHAPDHGQH